MNLIVEQLQADHKQLVRILYHLEREAKAFMGLNRTEACLETILDILDYVQVYPEIWHHPIEDVIYQVLLEKDAVEASVLADLMAEHETLELLTDNLHLMVNGLTKTAVVGYQKMRFLKACSHYVTRQLHHMEQEQKLLFPLLASNFGPKDWEEVTLRFKKQQPLDDSKLQEYTSRYQLIANSSVVTC
ncbi:MAG: hemerythrin domain-containing protein [Spongiibacteraceae bacterium]